MLYYNTIPRTYYILELTVCQLFNKISACYTHLDEITESKETNHISFNCLAFTLKQFSVFLPLKGYQNSILKS